jgi:hypothetical protein
MYYKGQRLRPSILNPIRYDPHDFAIFEGLEAGGKLKITVVQRRTKTEPEDWWTSEVAEEGAYLRRCLALYRSRVPVANVLSLLHEFAPKLTWIQNAPLTEPPNPYRFEGFYSGRSDIVEFDPYLINSASEEELRSLVLTMAQVIVDDLCL